MSKDAPKCLSGTTLCSPATPELPDCASSSLWQLIDKRLAKQDEMIKTNISVAIDEAVKKSHQKILDTMQQQIAGLRSNFGVLVQRVAELEHMVLVIGDLKSQLKELKLKLQKQENAEAAELRVNEVPQENKENSKDKFEEQCLNFQFPIKPSIQWIFRLKEFTYDDPHKWINEYPTCRGFRQSPIAIFTHKTIPITLPPLIFQLYDDPFNELVTVKNTGLTIEFEVPETVFGAKPFITGGFLRDIFTAETAHFHWGSPKQKGSEHALNGRRYDLELHILHKNCKYATISQAREFEDGLAVVAILFKAVKSENIYYPGLNVLYESLEELIKFNSTALTSKPISLGSLLGDINHRDLLTYRGSLTIPPCSESVRWYVFPEVLQISYFQLSKFWNVLDKRERPLHNNFRPIQPIEYRKVYRQTTLFWTENYINIPPNDIISLSEQW